MTQGVMISLFNNAALLLVLSVIYEVSYFVPAKLRRINPIINGFLIVVICVITMSIPFDLQPGVFFDTRSILISITALVFGPIPTMITVAAASIARLAVGGAGTLPGLAVIITSALIGLTWRRWLYPKSKKWRWLSVYVMSLCVHAIILACMLLLPYPDSLNIIRSIAFPLIIIYPVASVLFSLLLMRQQEHTQTCDQLQQSEQKYRRITDNITDTVHDLIRIK